MKAAVLGMLKRGIKVTVVKDAIMGVDVNSGDSLRAIEEMEKEGAVFATTSDVIQE